MPWIVVTRQMFAISRTIFMGSLLCQDAECLNHNPISGKSATMDIKEIFMENIVMNFCGGPQRDIDWGDHYHVRNSRYFWQQHLDCATKIEVHWRRISMKWQKEFNGRVEYFLQTRYEYINRVEILELDSSCDLDLWPMIECDTNPGKKRCHL